jgi:hypothetical protein
VDHVLGVDRGQTAAHLRPEVDAALPAHRPPAPDLLVERVPGDQVEHQVDAVVEGQQVVQGDDVGVPDAGERPGLAQEARQQVPLTGELRQQGLDRDLALQAPIVGAVDRPHAAGAEQLAQLVPVVEHVADADHETTSSPPPELCPVGVEERGVLDDTGGGARGGRGARSSPSPGITVAPGTATVSSASTPGWSDDGVPRAKPMPNAAPAATAAATAIATRTLGRSGRRGLLGRRGCGR